MQNQGNPDGRRAAASDAPLSTIFTPTYNRAYALHRVYESLRNQTSRDFEWLVIDDGSADGTERLVAGWVAGTDLPIRYLRQNRAGKHFAHNLALKEARGQLFRVLDSDDALVPDALEKLERCGAKFPPPSSMLSVGGLCCDQNGELVSDGFPSNPYDADLREMICGDDLRGEKLILGLTDVLRRYPFPEIPDTYLPEGIVWFDVAKKFKTRWLNQTVRIYYVNDPAKGITVSQPRQPWPLRARPLALLRLASQ